MTAGRTGEWHVRPVILAVLADGEEWATKEIRRAVQTALPPTQGDAAGANERENEIKYDAVVANPLQAERSLCRTGFVERLERDRSRITGRGLDEHHRLIAERAAFSLTADEMCNEDDWR